MRNYPLLCLTLILATVACSHSPIHQPTTHSVASGTVSHVLTNKDVRQWYLTQVATITTLNQQWLNDGIDIKQRAWQAYNIRANARTTARTMMADPVEVQALRQRDLKKYGNQNGPSFQYLIDKNRAKGLTGEHIYQAIIDSAQTTNATLNHRLGLSTKSHQQGLTH